MAEIKTRALEEVTGPLDYVDGFNSGATIMCLDEFRPVPGTPPGVGPHGDYVVSVLQSAGLKDSQIQKVHHKASSDARNELFESGPGSRRERLSAFIELTALEDLESTRHAVLAATTRPGNQIKTITNSIGSTPVRVANGIYYSSVSFEEDGTPGGITEVGEFIFEAMGLPPKPDADNVANFRGRLLKETARIVEESEAVQAGRQAFEQELRSLSQMGVAYFLSAGNDQKRVDDLVAAGFEVPPESAYISKSVPAAELVAALDTKGTPEPGDDEIANFSSAHPCVSYAANGVGVEVKGPKGQEFLNGSSLSAPWVAARRELHRQEHPELTGDALENSFRQESPRMLEGGIAIID